MTWGNDNFDDLEILVEFEDFDNQMEVREGFTELADGTWELSVGLFPLLLDNGNECFYRTIVSTPVPYNDKFVLTYPDDEDDGFIIVNNSLIFQTLDEEGEKEWSCFFVDEGTPWLINLPNYSPDCD